MEILSGILNLIAVGVTTIFAYGGFAGAVVAFLARIGPRVPRFASELATVACVAVSAWSFSGLYHDRQADLESLRTENRRLAETMKVQARQRAEMEKVARRQTALAAVRLQAISKLQEVQNAYEEAKAAGRAGRCPADDAYSRAMRSITVDRPEAADPASGTRRPDNSMPGPGTVRGQGN